jgi:hypothetical protein
VEKNTTINQSGGGIINVAEYMTGVTNTVNNSLEKSTASDEIKKLVAELTAQISAVASKVDPAKTQKLGKNLEVLSKELAQPEPERAWYDLSLKGIKEAAEAIGQIATPILGVVAKLSALLLV